MPLSTLMASLQDVIVQHFEGDTYRITAQANDVKLQPSVRRCYLTLEEFRNGEKAASARAVLWSNYYHEIEKFEKATGSAFKSGIEITCLVKVRFHKVYGLNLDVVQIDVAHTIGALELQRRQTLERLVKENPATIQLFDGGYYTYNNRLPLPPVVQRIALITAPNSDGQRDFLQELLQNKHNYKFEVAAFLTTIQGDQAHELILEQLRRVEESGNFEAVAIVRGGGSQTDFLPFDQYALAQAVANFPIPVFTGIGHDRNQSITDLMARELKTPTKAASFFVEHNFEFENRLIQLRQRLQQGAAAQLEAARSGLDRARRIVKLASPEVILNRGFAILKSGSKIITKASAISPGSELEILFNHHTIASDVKKITPHEKETNELYGGL